MAQAISSSVANGNTLFFTLPAMVIARSCPLPRKLRLRRAPHQVRGSFSYRVYPRVSKPATDLGSPIFRSLSLEHFQVDRAMKSMDVGFIAIGRDYGYRGDAKEPAF